MAVIFDCNETGDSLEDQTQESGQENGNVSGKVIACACAVPWKGGWRKEGAGKEEGWEIKAVAVHEGERYLHRGLAVKCMKALEKDLVEKAKVQQWTCVTLWLLVAECINGVYWRKRGYQEVRRSTEGDGTWGCKTSFEMVVYRKDVEFGAADKSQ